MAGKAVGRGRGATMENHTTTWAVTFFILYIRFMLMPIDAYSIFLQVFIIIILLVLSSDPEYFTHKFVTSRIAILLVLAYSSEQHVNAGKGKKHVS